MNVLCLVKQVLDSDIEPRILGDIVDREGGGLVLNPYDIFAVTEALSLRSMGFVVTALSVGSSFAYDALKYCLSLGCDRGVLLRSLDDELSPMFVARVIYDYVKDKGFDIIFTGKKAIDDNYGVVGGILASLLGFPFVYGISSFSLLSGGKVVCGRVSDYGDEEIELSLPCILSCDKGLNEPIVPSLQSIMSSRRKELEEVVVGLGDNFSIRRGLGVNDVDRVGKFLGGSVSEQVDGLMSFFLDKGFIGV